MKASDIGSILRTNFSKHSLQDVAGRVLKADELEKSPGALLLVHYVCLQSADLWDGPVRAAETDALAASLGEQLSDLLDAVSHGDVDLGPRQDAISRTVLDYLFD